MTPISPITARFVQWLESQGMNPNDLTTEQTDHLTTLFIVKLLAGQIDPVTTAPIEAVK